MVHIFIIFNDFFSLINGEIILKLSLRTKACWEHSPSI